MIEKCISIRKWNTTPLLHLVSERARVPFPPFSLIYIYLKAVKLEDIDIEMYNCCGVWVRVFFFFYLNSIWLEWVVYRHSVTYLISLYELFNPKRRDSNPSVDKKHHLTLKPSSLSIQYVEVRSWKRVFSSLLTRLFSIFEVLRVYIRFLFFYSHSNVIYICA